MRKDEKMKKIVNLSVCIFLMVSTFLCLTSCDKKSESIDLWECAIYKEDTTLWDGNKIIVVEVEAEEKTVEFTINTDKEILGDALEEHNLIFGEQGAYGLYVKVVNGIKADYDENQSYWGFNKDGESMMTGVDGEKISGGEHYEIVYTKQ